ncbi:DUF302 domain-containing protein [Acidithiobacillus thiooxidans]|uniref:DUF302 domain-containing protein n=1 Tax=Acidithiobacillus thiooxidans ATCC 19377 TaxID=637390 RepID=A0A5P9XRZ8_ACITH|nr:MULTISPECIES: DUF302 domain-containing protein [Acidithiobacillus]MBU2741968.1 DUF302 domain-containing protein [Acidithiobacillus albertensis]MBU2837744.1 DUF302 domain-containing protein [Acidithiobacillus thiooxidans]QFX96480.1 hypothetical protein GCD22_02262 [Acidithiobacillus thiooxidans ATCC 19377]
MRKYLCMVGLAALWISPMASATSQSMTRIQSHHSVSITVKRLKQVIVAKGATIFADINFAHGAKLVGMPLRPTQLLIFGNPRLGTQLLESRQTAGLYLPPMKILVWRDAHGQVWVGYRNPQKMVHESGVVGHVRLIRKMQHLLGVFSQQAVGQP